MRFPERNHLNGALTLSQKRALYLAAAHGGTLVLIERCYRASFALGAEKVKLTTVQALQARNLLEPYGAKMMRLTMQGHYMASEVKHIAETANAAVQQDRARRAARSKGPRQPHAALYSSTNQSARRFPYADD